MGTMKAFILDQTFPGIELLISYINGMCSIHLDTGMLIYLDVKD